MKKNTNVFGIVHKQKIFISIDGKRVEVNSEVLIDKCQIDVSSLIENIELIRKDRIKKSMPKT